MSKALYGVRVKRFSFQDWEVKNLTINGDLITTSPTIQGTVLAGTGLTMPAFTLGGTVTATGQEIDAAILDACVAKGTWTASGTWTIPAVTLNGAVTGNGQSVTGVASLGVASAGSIYTAVTNNSLRLFGGDASAGGGAIMYLYGKTGAASGYVVLTTPDAAGTADVERFNITGVVARSIVNFSDTDVNYGAAYTSYTEMAAPGAGAANTARIYAVVDGGTLTDLAAVFQDGTVDIFAQEVTPLDAPTFTYPSGTEAKIILRKGHPGLVTLVAKFPNNKEFVIKEYQYHDADKVAANSGCERPLPADWEVSTAAERLAKVEAEALAAQAEASK